MSLRPGAIALNTALATSQQTVIEILLTKTASGTIAPLVPTDATIVGMGTNLDRASAAALQAEINTKLGVLTATSTEEVDAATVFAATPMGLDAVGAVIPCSGQIRKVTVMEVVAPTATAAIKDVKPAALSATLGTDGLAVTPKGNIVLRIQDLGLDAAAVGAVVKLRIYCESK